MHFPCRARDPPARSHAAASGGSEVPASNAVEIRGRALRRRAAQLGKDVAPEGHAVRQELGRTFAWSVVVTCDGFLVATR